MNYAGQMQLHYEDDTMAKNKKIKKNKIPERTSWKKNRLEDCTEYIFYFKKVS